VLNISLSSLLFAQIITAVAYPLIWVSYTTILPLTLLFPVKFSVFSIHPELCTSTWQSWQHFSGAYHSIPICSFRFGGDNCYRKLTCLKFFRIYLFMLKPTNMDFMLNYKLISDFALVGIVHRNERLATDLDLWYSHTIFQWRKTGSHRLPRYTMSRRKTIVHILRTTPTNFITRHQVATESKCRPLSY
jgi:hypothetical protein